MTSWHGKVFRNTGLCEVLHKSSVNTHHKNELYADGDDAFLILFRIICTTQFRDAAADASIVVAAAAVAH